MVGMNEKVGVLERWQMIDIGFGPWRGISFSFYFDRHLGKTYFPFLLVQHYYSAMFLANGNELQTVEAPIIFMLLFIDRDRERNNDWDNQKGPESCNDRKAGMT
jgi:hypothetical protein